LEDTINITLHFLSHTTPHEVKNPCGQNVIKSTYATAKNEACTFLFVG